MGVKLPIRVLMGRTQMCLRDITLLGSGSVVELECSPDDPVEIVVNDRVIAQGEIVVVGGNYGVRITRIATGGEARPAVDGDRSAASFREVEIMQILVGDDSVPAPCGDPGDSAWPLIVRDRLSRAPAWQVRARNCDAAIQAEAAQLTNAVNELKRRVGGTRECRRNRNNPGPQEAGLSDMARGKILKMHRVGRASEQIAETLGLPKGEVDLLVKVHKIVMQPYEGAALGRKARGIKRLNRLPEHAIRERAELRKR